MTAPLRAGDRGGRADSTPEGSARDDGALTARVRAGDAAAFQVLFDAHFNGLAGYVRGYVKDMAVAEEVVQDLFFRVWESRGTFALRTSAASYLYSAARNQALLSVRRARREQLWAHELAHREPEFAESADAATRWNETAAAISRAIDALPPRCRAVFLMSRGHGLSTADVAMALGMSPKSVEQQIWRALVTLRKHLSPFLHREPQKSQL